MKACDMAALGDLLGLGLAARRSSFARAGLARSGRSRRCRGSACPARDGRIGRRHLVQQLAVVADQQHRVRDSLQIVLQPQRRLRGRGGWSARRAAAGRARRTARRPAPRACASRRRTRGRAAVCGCRVEAEAGQDRAARAGAAWAPMSASRVWISAMRCGIVRGLGLGQQRACAPVGGQHGVDQALRPARRLLRHACRCALARGQGDAAVVGVQLAGDQLQQGRLARAVAADEADADGPSGMADRGACRRSRGPPKR